MSAVILHLGTTADSAFNSKLPELSLGQQVAWKQRLTSPKTVAEIDAQCKAYGVSGIFCTNPDFLELLLKAQPDFIPPNNRRGLTLDDYQGSLLHTREGIPVVIANPLENLVTTKWAIPAAKRFLSKLTAPEKWFPQTAFTWELVTPQTVESLYQEFLEHSTLIAIDIETPKPNPLRTINCVGYAAYFPKTHTSKCIVIPYTDMFWVTWVKKFNQLPQPKIFQNGLYDNVYFMRFNSPVYNWLYDTQHLFHSWYSEYPKRLDFVTAYALRDVRYWKDDGKSGNLQDYYRYNAKDCWATLNAWMALVIECDSWALKNYTQEFPLVFPCITCELEGLRVDSERLEQVKKESEQEIQVREAAFRKMIGVPTFNVISPKQTKELFKALGVGHLPGTDAANMLKARAAHPLNERVLGELVDIRKEKKLLSTYFQSEKFWNNRCYYKLNPAGTDTGRLASSESSFWCGLQIQNMPRGDKVKQFLIADPGWKLCEIDKEQAEARCVAYLAGEESLISLVESPKDYHSWNASQFFGVPYESIYDEATKKVLNRDLRDLSKRTNHGANYNMGPAVMLDTMGPKNVLKAKSLLKLPSSWSLKNVCKHLLDSYAKTYPGIKGRYYDSLKAEIVKTKKLVSPLGWTRIFFGDITNKSHLNALVAHPSQNLSVAIINKEFYNIWHSQIYGELKGLIRLKAQIHDSILFQVREDKTELVKYIEEKYMRTTVKVIGADGVTRDMMIPSAISDCENRWSDTK